MLTFVENPWSTSLLCCISFPRPDTGFESLWDARSQCDTASVPRSSRSPASASSLYSLQYSVEVGSSLAPTLLSHFLLLAAGENKCQGKKKLGMSAATIAPFSFASLPPNKQPSLSQFWASVPFLLSVLLQSALLKLVVNISLLFCTLSHQNSVGREDQQFFPYLGSIKWEKNDSLRVIHLINHETQTWFQVPWTFFATM